MPWKFVGFAGDHDSVQVVYSAGDNDCVKPWGFYVHQDGGDMIVEAVARPGNVSVGCADKIVYFRATIPLPVPVNGSVRLVHAPFNRSVGGPAQIGG